MSLEDIAQETLSILARGTDSTAGGRVVDLRGDVEAAVAGTRLHRPDDFPSL